MEKHVKKELILVWKQNLIFHLEELFGPRVVTREVVHFLVRAKGDEGDPWIGSVWRGLGAAGVRAKPNGFSRANSQSNPFGVEPRIGGGGGIRSISLSSPFQQNQNGDERATARPDLPAGRPAGWAARASPGPAARPAAGGSFL